MNKSMLTTLLATALSSQFSMAGLIHVKEMKPVDPSWVTESSPAGRNRIMKLVESAKNNHNKPDSGKNYFNDKEGNSGFYEHSDLNFVSYSHTDSSVMVGTIPTRQLGYKTIAPIDREVVAVVELPDGARRISTKEIFELDGEKKKEKIKEFQALDLRKTPEVGGQVLMGRSKHEYAEIGEFGTVLKRRRIEIVNPPSRVIRLEQSDGGRNYQALELTLPDFIQGTPFRVGRAPNSNTVVIQTKAGLEYELRTINGPNQKLEIDPVIQEPRKIDLNSFVLKSVDEYPAKGSRKSMAAQSKMRLDAMGTEVQGAQPAAAAP